MQIIPLNLNAIPETDNWLVGFIFFLPIIIGIFYVIKRNQSAQLWKKGIFPPNSPPTEDNFLEAYLALGAKLMSYEYQASKGKIQYINQYFSRYFKFANYHFGDSLVFSFRYPIQTKTVTDWMKKHITTEGGRSQIIYFLTGLAMVSGNLTRQELLFLKKINSELDLKDSHLTQILSIFAAYEQTRQENSQSNLKNEKTKYDYEILGLADGATKEEIKKAYRKLVKIHHPDNFATSSQSQQKLAQEKFIEIQRAYESLTT
jgi:DnaJ like chaperone protein